MIRRSSSVTKGYYPTMLVEWLDNCFLRRYLVTKTKCTCIRKTQFLPLLKSLDKFIDQIVTWTHVCAKGISIQTAPNKGTSQIASNAVG